MDSTETHLVLLPVIAKCRHIMYVSQVVNAKDSFMSHDQKELHAEYAHTEPNNIPKVRHIVPTVKSFADIFSL